MKFLSCLAFCLLIEMPFVQAQNFAASQLNPFSITPQGSRSSPFLVDIDDNGTLDLLTGLVSGDYGSYENIGHANFPSFGSFFIKPGNIGSIGGNATPFLVDLDDDNDFDMFSGGDGGLRTFDNHGNAQVVSFGSEVQSPFLIISPSGISKPYMADIDNDGNPDLFVGSSDGNTYYYHNTGSLGSPSFAQSATNPFGLKNVGLRSAPAFADLDNDGDFDAVIGNKSGLLFYFENTGTVSNPAFDSIGTDLFNNENIGQDTKPCFGDLDGDGDLDLLVGTATGDYYYFENTTQATAIKENNFSATLLVYPNPTTGKLSIDLGKTYSNVEITISSIIGKVIHTQQFEATNKLNYEIEGTSGLYIFEVHTADGNLAMLRVLKE